MAANPVTAMPNPRRPKVIVIDDDNGQVPFPYDNRHINANEEEAVWVSLNGSEFTVRFDPQHHPFAKHKFKVPAGGTVHSEPVVTGNNGEEFKYSVDGPLNTNDPTVIINR